jgi:hypothetical protein
MKPIAIQNLSLQRANSLSHHFLKKPKFSSSYELHPGLIAMVRAQSFSGLENENPCHHLQEFEEMCSCLNISGMTQETLK